MVNFKNIKDIPCNEKRVRSFWKWHACCNLWSIMWQCDIMCKSKLKNNREQQQFLFYRKMRRNETVRVFFNTSIFSISQGNRNNSFWGHSADGECTRYCLEGEWLPVIVKFPSAINSWNLYCFIALGKCEILHHGFNIALPFVLRVRVDCDYNWKLPIRNRCVLDFVHVRLGFWQSNIINHFCGIILVTA